MKVICICDKIGIDYLRISIGKSYDVLSINKIRDTYLIINDDGIKCHYNRRAVLPLEEWRENRLNELGI